MTPDRLGQVLQPRLAPLVLGLLAAIAAMFMLAMVTGPAPVSPGALFDFGGQDVGALVMQQIRLPRALLALLVGASLGASGAALQGLLRNPLAEPGLIGVSACAALGAVAAFYSGLSQLNAWALPASAMLGALVSVLLLQGLAGRGAGTLTLILAGVAVNALASALIALLLSLSPNPFASYEIVVWLLGSLADRSFEHVGLVLPFVVAGLVLLLSCGRGLDALALGEDVAASLGFTLAALRGRVILGSALAVGAVVSVSGIVGFIGLVVPHLLRPLVGFQPRLLLPVSALGGALLTLAADVVVRVLTPAGELKLGVVTALLGTPFFLHLVIRNRTLWG